MDNPFISICIPAYKRTNYLKRLLDSIVLQNFHDFEVIISDDSNDNSVSELIHDFKEKINIVYFHNNPSLRTPANMNFSISKAKGEWIKILHDDDWLSNESSLQSFADATKNGNKFIFSSYSNFIEKDKTYQLITPPYGFKKNILNTPHLLLSHNVIGPPSVSLFHKSVTVSYDARLNWRVDQEYYIRVIQLLNNFTYINEPLINVGVSESQVSTSCFNVPSVEIPEMYILLSKYGTSPLKNIMVYDAYWRILRNTNTNSKSKLESFGQTEWPKVILSMVELQSKFNQNTLRNGVISKTLMSISYIYNLIKSNL
jgi:glycosyltransferase involved in cell wall biosynthesis